MVCVTVVAIQRQSSSGANPLKTIGVSAASPERPGRETLIAVWPRASCERLASAAACAGIAATLLGFLIAALAILTALLDKQLLINLRKTGHLHRMLRETAFAAAAFLTILLLSLVALFAPAQLIKEIVALSAAACVIAAALLLSAGIKLYLIISLLGQNPH